MSVGRGLRVGESCTCYYDDFAFDSGAGGVSCNSSDFGDVFKGAGVRDAVLELFAQRGEAYFRLGSVRGSHVDGYGAIEPCRL